MQHVLLSYSFPHKVFMKKVIKKVATWLKGLGGKKQEAEPESKSRTSPPPRKGQQSDDERRPQRGRSRRGHSKERGTKQEQSKQKQSEQKQPHQKQEHPQQKRRPQRGRRPSQHPRQQPEEVPPTAAELWDPKSFDISPADGKTRFHDLDIPQEIMRAIADLKFQYCTPVQAGVLPEALKGSDTVGRAQTGTGKSAAFLITILAHLIRKPLAERRKGTPRALILAPTRELVLQIEKDAKGLSKHMNCNIISIFGGMNYERQKRYLDANVDIIVATPGRLLDFRQQKLLHLNHVEILVIDEADRMLDMGFIPDIRTIVHSTPPKDERQTMFFTATLTDDVRRLASNWTREPHQIDIEPEQVAVNTVDQKVYICTTDEKLKLLYNLITQEKLERVIVFGNRRDETQRLAEALMARGISCGLLSGDVSQHERVKTLEGFREGKFRVLVATDVAARGLHIEGVSHVVNFNLPLDAEDYVHRIGRTGRAGASGISVSFACEEDGTQIPLIEEYIGRKLETIYPPEEWFVEIPPPSADAPKIKTEQRKRYDNRRRPGRGGPRRGSGGRSGGGHRK